MFKLQIKHFFEICSFNWKIACCKLGLFQYDTKIFHFVAYLKSKVQSLGKVDRRR